MGGQRSDIEDLIFFARPRRTSGGRTQRGGSGIERRKNL